MPAITVSYCIGTIVSFVGNRKWTFGLNFALHWLLVRQFGLPQIPVELFATGCVAATTFLVMRLWVFRSKPEGAVD